MTFTRILTNICSDDLAASRDFYVALLGFEVNYDSDWYIQLLTHALYEARGLDQAGLRLGHLVLHGLRHQRRCCSRSTMSRASGPDAISRP